MWRGFLYAGVGGGGEGEEGGWECGEVRKIEVG